MDHFPAVLHGEHLSHPKTSPGKLLDLLTCLWPTPSLEALALSVLVSLTSFSGDPELRKGHKKHLRNPNVPALQLFILGSHQPGDRTVHG